VYKEVTDVWETEVKIEDQRHIFFSNGTELKCSNNHPIMVLDKGTMQQILPDDLKPEHQIISEYGITTVNKITYSNRPPAHIDITVEDSHVFFASSKLDDEQILTHNSQGGVRGGCVGADSLVKICKGIEVDGIEYLPSDTIMINNSEVSVHKLATVLTNMSEEEIKNASLQDLYERSESIKTSSNNDT